MKIQTKHAEYSLISQLGIIVNSELEREFDHFLPAQLIEERMIESLKSELSDSEIEERLSAVRNITLNITEQCNFRCTYCTFSGNYAIGRVHNPKRMNITTARKAIDYLITLISNKKRKMKVNTIYIGFYGGETLLEFDRVRRIIEYTRGSFRKKGLDEMFVLEFQLNTNGYLLKDHILDFFVENNVKLAISIDGPEDEHDKFRHTVSGSKTWKNITDNLDQIRKKYPAYYEDNINFLVTLHPFHDFKKIDDFFLNSSHFSPGKITANYVNLLSLKKEIAEKLKMVPSHVSRLALKRSAETFDNKLTFRSLDYNTKFTAMCFPGGIKLFVDSDGKFHICERIKADVSIGNVDDGIDYEKIRSIHRQWTDVIIKNRCWECAAWSICSVCAAQSEEENGVGIDCVFKDDVVKRLKTYLEYKEDETRIKEPDVPPFFDNVMDYVRHL